MERKFLTFRTYIKRLARKTICFLNPNSRMILLSACLSIDLSLVEMCDQHF
ncbi:TPA: hypothetical protein RJG04_002983 [Legionella pneumophila]|nr:hypothetical protein [Legionella pneumophila]HDV5941519.1 hypothetical protein [Legionella pneumophila]HEL9698506.1 hypothetical protein [Legionella pneumophila]